MDVNQTIPEKDATPLAHCLDSANSVDSCPDFQYAEILNGLARCMIAHAPFISEQVTAWPYSLFPLITNIFPSMRTPR
jgi:hypothetical protein